MRHLKCCWLIFLVFFLVGAVGAPTALAEQAAGPKWKVTLGGWFANDSSYDENPGSQTSGKVWGDFATNWYALVFEGRLSDRFLFDVGYTRGDIQKNRMYLHATSSYTEISGFANKFHGTGYYRLIEDAGSYLDGSLALYYNAANKSFSDKVTNGVLTNPGEWGDYSINWFGAALGARGRYMLVPVFGFGGKLGVSPYVSNNTEVTGYGPVMKESANGWGYNGEVSAVWIPGLSGFEVEAGYRYERIYFNEPSASSFDLDIRYGGPFVEVSYRF
ncbi:MAG: hypothetical protein ABIL58_09065 [Pseudomonadota bacterium]